MHKLFLKAGTMALLLTAVACSPAYQLTNTERQRIVVDRRYDALSDAQAVAFLAPYKQKVDSAMSPIVGTVEHDMAPMRPESDLSNLLADIMIWAAKDYGEKPVMSVYNMGGIRAALTKGPVTYGDVLAIAPFENKIAFTTLTGEKLLKLFQQIARRGGEGVSHGVQLVISADGKLLSARLNGKEIDPKENYRITTIDYLVQGNDGLEAFREGSDLVSPQEEKNNTRFIIMNYFKEMAAKKQPVTAAVEGRITISK